MIGSECRKMSTTGLVLLMAVSVVLAMAFTGCSGDDGGDSPSGGGGSSSGGNFTANSSSSDNTGGDNGISYGTLSYKGKNYKTVEIGTQTWMAENLNYDVPNNDTDVCYYNDPANCTKYGRLYDWATAMALDDSCKENECADKIKAKHQGICPDGWHIPSYEEWEILVDYAGGASIAGLKLKANSGWNDDYEGESGNGTDDYGFSALSGGDGFSYEDFQGNVGNRSGWWSSTEYKWSDMYAVEEAKRKIMWNSSSEVGTNNAVKFNINYVRCLKD